MRGKLKLLELRIKLVKRLLNLTGFKQISGHWIYVPKINKESIVIDLGANKGNFSKEMVKKFSVSCYAVEPDINLFKEINVPGISKYNYAISKNNGPVSFFISNNDEASSLIKDFQSNWANKGEHLVEGVTWELLIQHLNLTQKKISILKVDIEGSELDLIDSFTSDNISLVEQITIEFHDWINKSLHERTLFAIKKLISLQFMAVSNTPDHSWPVEILFINKKAIQFNYFKRILLSVYQKLTFLHY